MTRKPVQGRLVLALSALLLGTGFALLATGAFASRGEQGSARYSKKARFSVFEHHSKRARAANAVAAGAVLATTVTSGGVENEVYVSREGAEICLSDNEVGGISGEVCGAPSIAADKGLDLTLRGIKAIPTVALLVPNGVQTATFIDNDGSEHPAEVENNVVVRTDPSITSVQYVMPGDTHESVTVPTTQ
jgi:hypothetical protein